MSRPYIEVHTDELAFREFGGRITVPWEAVERFVVSPPGGRQVIVLRRSPEALLTIALGAMGWSTESGPSRVQAEVCAATPFVQVADGHANAVVGLDEVTFAQTTRRVVVAWLVWSAMITTAVVLAVDWTRWRSLSMYWFIGGLLYWFPPRPNLLPARSVTFAADGAVTDQGRWPRRFTQHHHANSIARIVVHEGHRTPRLAILFADHSIIDIPHTLLGGRDEAALTALAAQLTAMSARADLWIDGHGTSAFADGAASNR